MSFKEVCVMQKVLLVVTLIVGLGFSGLSVPFSGSWEMDLTFAPQSPITCIPVTGFRTILTIDYTISDWTFRSVSRLEGGTGWNRQDFLAEGAIGAFEFTNRLRFVPAPDPAFTFLRSAAKVSIAGVDLTGRVLIVEVEGVEEVGPGDPGFATPVEPGVVIPVVHGGVIPVEPGVKGGSGFAAGLSAPAGDLTFAATAYFGSLAFDPPTDHPDYPWVVYLPPTHTPIFRGLDVDLVMPFYCTTLTIDIDFVPYPYPGFQDITFTVPEFPLGIPGFALDLKVEYTLARKAVTVTPHITIGEWLHFQPFISVVGLIDALHLEGLRLEWFPTDKIRFRYHFDARPNIEPNIVRGYGYCPDRGCPHQQMVELRYKTSPITLTMAGFWYSWWGRDPLPMFPNWIDINLAVDILPGFTIRTGLYFQCTALAFMTFGFDFTW